MYSFSRVKKKNWIGWLVALFMGVSVYSFAVPIEDAETLLMQAPSKIDFQKFESVIMKNHETYELTDDQHIIYTFHRIVKLFTYADRGRWAQTRFGFREDLDSIQVLIARTIQSDGTVVEVPEHAKTIVQPRAFSGFYDFHTYRELVVSQTGMDEGCIMELAVQITKSIDDPILFSGAVPLASDLPILDKSITLIAPESVQLFAQAGDEYAIEGSNEAEKRKLVCQVQGTRGFINEQNSEPLIHRLPYLYYSTSDNWQDVYQYLQHKMEDTLILNDRIQEIVDEITEPYMDPVTKLIAIHEWVNPRFRNAGSIPFDAGYVQFRSTDEIINHLYGSIFDRAALYLVMLQACDTDAHVIWTSPHAIVLPNVDLFTDLYVVPNSSNQRASEYIWFHPFHGFTNWERDLLQHRYWISNEPNQHPRPFSPEYLQSADNRVIVHGKLSIDESFHATGEATISVSGYFNPSDWRIREGNREALCSQILATSLPGVKVDSVETLFLGSTTVLKVAFTWEEPSKNVHNHFLLRILPDYLHTAYTNFQRRWEHRLTDLAFPFPFEEHIELTLSLPHEGIVWDRIPASFEVSGNGYAIQQEYTQQDNYTHDVIVRRQVQLTDRLIDPETYVTFWQNWMLAIAESNTTCILKKE